MNTSLTRRSFVKVAGVAGTVALGARASATASAVALADESADDAQATAECAGEARMHAAQLNPQADATDPTGATCPSLFTEWTFGPYTLPNRFVKSAAGYISVTSQGIRGDLLLDYYAKLAQTGVGVVYCDDFCELYDHFKAIEDVGKLTDFTDEDLANFAQVIKDNGALAGYQLATMGLMYSGFETDPTSLFQTSTCMDMTAQEIQDLIADTIAAAKRLQDCGFDCVELNCAGENTGETFMSRSRNQRDDEYGPQNFENRTRFITDIIKGIKETCGQDFPVQVLINGIEENDRTIGDNALYTTVEENVEMCKLFEAVGADALHIRIGPRGMHVAEFAGDLFFSGYGIEGTTSYGTQFDFKRHWQGKLKADQSGLGVMTRVAAEIKRGVSIPVGCVTYMDPARDPQFFEDLIANGDIDFILMNRPLNVEPEYLTKLRDGRLDEIRPCTRCLHCHWDVQSDGSMSFSCRTLAAHPYRINTGQLVGGYDPEPAAEAKNVMVVGGGPAGMEAARVAAERGHNVTLYEKNGMLGGLLPFANHIKGQHENLSALNTYLQKELEVTGVQVVTETEVDQTFIEDQAPDAVIIAVGGARDTLGLASTAGTQVISIDDVVGAEIADDVVVVGSNAQAVDLVMWLLAQGKHVQVVTPSAEAEIGAGHSYWVRCYTQPMIKALGCRYWPQASVDVVGDGSITITADSGAKVEIACGTVIEALDSLSNASLAEGLSMEAYAVGDCAKPFNIGDAICMGNNAARQI